MLTSSIANVLTWLYPIGNTPAISLTQDLPRESEADILLLGCGDVRNVLFTAHVDPRPLDITCCDFEKIIIARNILLLSLILDDVEDQCHELNWNAFYHVRIDSAALELYGKRLRFCDNGSFQKTREMWSFYAAKRTGKELSKFEKQYDVALGRAKSFRNQHVYLTGCRSASPTIAAAVLDLDALHKQYWKNGNLETDQSRLANSIHVNPMFCSPREDVAPHYGADPLLGFHLATAYAPLTSNSPLYGTSKERGLQKVIAAAKNEFRTWCNSYRKRFGSIILRFFTGDAIAFSYTLQHIRDMKGMRDSLTNAPSANWYRDRFHYEPLVLDGEDFSAKDAVPSSFNIIDTSNLIDHVGAMNLLVATTPLLKTKATSCLYTEKLVRLDATMEEFLSSLLCGDLQTMSILLGLTSVDFVTNTTAISAGDEALVSADVGPPDNKEGDQQLYARIAWKRPLGTAEVEGLSRIHFESEGLAQVLHRLYTNMFENESLADLMSKATMTRIKKKSLLYYQRASFAAVLRLVKTRVEVDWTKTMRLLLNLIESDQTLFFSRSCIQELYLWLHLLGVYSVEILKASETFLTQPARRGLYAWKTFPSAVCITLKVPRGKLKVITDRPITKVGTPPVHCILRSPAEAGNQWENIFAAVQLGFGALTTYGSRESESFTVSITEDTRGWTGTAPLFVSFHVPTWNILQEPGRATVAFAAQATPQNTMAFTEELGLEMSFFKTTLDDEQHVFITKTMPNQQDVIRVGGFSPEASAPGGTSDATMRTSATVEKASGRIVSLTQRAELRSEKAKNALANGCNVNVESRNPFNHTISFEPSPKFSVHFPAPVLSTKMKTRVARKSLYVELEAPLAGRMDWPSHSNFLHPVLLDPRTEVPVNWNLPSINLDVSPILDVSPSSRKKLEWLTTHISMMWSHRERALRQNPSLPTRPGEKLRLELKEGLFSILMRYSGVQGQRAAVFGINCPTGGGVHILLFVSALRLDLARRSVAVDAAALPLQHRLMPSLGPRIQKLVQKVGVMQIMVDEAELKLWKELLPAWVERCRAWPHKATCEYRKSEERIPLSVEGGEPALCSCGNGVFPPGYGKSIPLWEEFREFAVRVAIGPVFSAALVEEAYRPSAEDVLSRRAASAARSTTDACQVCGKEAGPGGVGLMKCAACKKVQYCSKECQKADWKKHKSVCSKSG